MKKFMKTLLLVLLSAALTATTAGAAATATTAKAVKIKKIQIGFATGGFPTEYVDDKGNPTGYDIETMKLVDKLLPGYEFEYTGLDQTAVYAGLTTGKFQVALSNAFWTPERESKYLFPKENIGASILGLFTKKSVTNVKSLSDAAAKKFKISPILAGDGQYYVVEDYNKTHPYAKITLTPTDDTNAFIESFEWVVNGRYDFGLIPQQYWDSLVAAKDGSLNKYYKDLNYYTFGSVKTWAILAKGQESFAKDFDKAIAKLKSQGKLVQLAKKFYGYNTFAKLSKNAK